MKAESNGVASLNLLSPVTLLSQEGQRTLELEEQVTRLFDELRGPLFRYLICLSMSSTDADEIVQETFLRLYRHLHAGGREDNLRGWVFRVAHNISINELKRRKYVAVNSLDRWPEFNPSRADSTPTPEELLIRKEKKIHIHIAMASLSELQRECLYLRVEGFRYREIADILGVTISTIAESLRRAIKKLTKEPHA